MSAQWICYTLYRVLGSFECSDGRMICQEVQDASLLSVELVYRELLVKRSLEGLDEGELEACDFLRTALEALQSLELGISTRVISPPVVNSVSIGRPRFKIAKAQLENLIDNKFTVPQMANIIGVSVRTIHRRMSEYRISISAQYANLTDDELDEIVGGIQRDHPMCGNQQMQGHLFSMGLRVQQHRIRESQRRVDPSGTIIRRLHTINRRKYRVRAPRSLYHIDGNHKLIR